MTNISASDGEDEIQKVLDRIKGFQENDDSSSLLRPEAQTFLQTAHKFLECRKRMDATFEKIEGSKVLEDFVLGLPENCSHEKDFRQQSTLGEPARTLDELYKAATIIRPLFEEFVNGIVEQAKKRTKTLSDIRVVYVPLKGRERALEKAQNEYHDKGPGPDIAWLSDINRLSVIFETVDDIIICLELIRDSDHIQIVKAKNRFKHPTLTGYRDFNVKFRLKSADGGFQHTCELQIHQKDLKKVCIEMESHESYEYFRSYYVGETDTLEESLEDLKHIATGNVLDFSFVHELLETSKDERRLDRLGALFEIKLCEYHLALKVYTKLLEIQMRKYGPLHESIGSAYLKIATVLRKQGKEDDAIAVFRESLNAFRNLIGEDSIQVATVCIKLAHSLQRQGNLEEALDLYKQSLQIYKKTVGLIHRDSANTFHSMATVLKQQGKLVEATDLLKQALGIFRETCGEDVLQASYAYNTLGTVYEMQDKMEDAMELYKKSLHIKRGIAGKAHPYVSFTLNCIANLLRKEGDLVKALSTYQESLDSYYKSVGEGHPLVGFTCTKIANVLCDQGKPKDSKIYYEKALVVYLKVYGADHPKVAKVKEEMRKVT
ncbi:unnamed protein product [Cylindrotheca closterium]|uniref:RelA/SpoT domain-containing protein n=1 Tax=Cylindrotheca closterium TaxID=2856 RepID=A0AAD2GCC9_9STRA|nr:unnamed protein product [Cylindrotheca closterium]